MPPGIGYNRRISTTSPHARGGPNTRAANPSPHMSGGGNNPANPRVSDDSAVFAPPGRTYWPYRTRRSTWSG